MDPGADPETLVTVTPGPAPGTFKMRNAERLAIDAEHDVAILKVEGPALPALVLRDSATVGEGDSLLFTGFPIGAVLGLFPVTHRAMVSAISPIAIPSNDGKQLDSRAIRRLRATVYPVFQLDATAYPGNSGSPLYDPATGEVVGILNMVFVKSSKESALAQPSGISYAIPSRYLIELAARLKP
jgi:S1-C subfamily serine protease